MLFRICSYILAGLIASITTHAFANDHLTEGVLIGDAYEALEATRTVCAGIAQELSDISGVSIANTAITSVGTVAAGGALVAGIKKEKTDQEIAEILEEMCQNDRCDPTKIENMSDQEFYYEILPHIIDGFEAVYESELKELRSELEKLRSQQQQKTEQSKKLGNWRTGLMAGSTATNIASAILAGINRDQSDLAQHVSACNSATQQLQQKLQALQKLGISPFENPIFSDATITTDTCGKIDVKDIEKIEKRMTAVMGTSVAGATIGAVGTGISAAANSKKIREDNTDAGQKKEANLNTSANVMAGANIVTGAVETGFNASLIALTKKLIKKSQECEGNL